MNPEPEQEGKKSKMYINNHSYFSLRYGTVKPKTILQIFQSFGVKTAALTDINNTSASLDFVRLSSKFGIRPVLGIDFRNGAQQMYIALAKNNEGYKEINDHLSDHLYRDAKFEKRAPEFEHTFVIYPFQLFFSSNPRNTELLEHEFIGISPSELTRLKFTAWKDHPKLIALQTCTFRNKRDFNAHRLLRAIDNNTLLSKLPESEEGSNKDRFLNPAIVEQYFAETPELLIRTNDILEQCEIEFEFGTDKPHKNLQTYTGSQKEDDQLIEKLCKEGLKYRYPNPTDQILQRVDKELKIIKEKAFTSYFLINWDITNYARSKGYFYVGRGSGANSVVAYLLRITDVDPIDLDLYFERFINLYRQNPPDFDIDFSWMDRDDITRYIFERFPNVALLAAYSTFQYRAVVRELGKVFGLPKHEIDLLSKGDFVVDKLDQISLLVLKYSGHIQGFPNHISIHAGGILISEKPIHNYTATFMPPKGYPTTHFDMIVAEDIGLYKFDILSQRGLGKIKDALEIISYNKPEDEVIDIHDMHRFKEDPLIKELLRTAQAIGCFYVESPAMRMLMRKLRVDDYLGLVAASSVIRPGVAKSGMMREYILRYRFPERRQDAHPIMLDIMPETYGVMVYQEDVIKVAHYFAGLDLGEADILRRGMSGKFRSREEFDRVKENFFINCREKGYSDELTKEIWRQTESFAGYAFAKGHSASYAVESYQSLFLKAYYPLEYMVATINNFGGFYRTELYVHEARMHGGIIEEPCVNHSGAATVIHDKTIFLGFGLIKDLEHQCIKKMLIARNEEGAFESLTDFVKRVAISLEQLSIFIRCNAFRFTGKSKKQLLWDAHFLLGNQKKSKPSATLFEPQLKKYELPELYTAELENAFDQMELIGFPLSSPFNLLDEKVEQETLAKDLPNYIGEVVTVVGYLITSKKTKTSDGKTMYFGTFIDREGNWLDTVHFPEIAAKFPFRGRGIYSVTGKLLEEFDCLNVEASSMKKLAIIADPRYSDARMSKLKTNNSRAALNKDIGDKSVTNNNVDQKT